MLRRDFSLGINVYFEAFRASGNPLYLWLAVEICIMLDKEFPNWLRRYLLQCAERMQSGKAKKGDLRKVLPWIFDFSKKSGPGNLLDPDKNAADAAARRGFALRFATKIVQQGEEPSKALTSACDEVLDQERAGKDVKTLRSWIVKDFGLKS